MLTMSLSLPEPTSTDTSTARRIKHYYKAQKDAYFHYCQHVLLPQASSALHTCTESAIPFQPMSATMHYVITYQSERHLSLYTQSKDGTPQQKNILRHADTWDLSTGYPTPITSFFPPKFRYRHQLVTIASKQIADLEAQGVAKFHPNLKLATLHRKFNPRNFYITPEGVVCFYQMYTIAPAVEQIPVFLVPFDQEHATLAFT